MNKIKNYTPHAINVVLDTGVIEIISSGLARCTTVRTHIGTLNSGIPIFRTSFGDVEGLPAPSEGIIYVVSMLAAQALKGIRDDIYIVDDIVRNEAGQIIGCRALATV